MSLHLWLAFVAASAVLLVIPGPTLLTVIGYSVAHGRRAQLRCRGAGHAQVDVAAIPVRVGTGHPAGFNDALGARK